MVTDLLDKMGADLNTIYSIDNKAAAPDHVSTLQCGKSATPARMAGQRAA
jgi:hypothetical protein